MRLRLLQSSRLVKVWWLVLGVVGRVDAVVLLLLLAVCARVTQTSRRELFALVGAIPHLHQG